MAEGSFYYQVYGTGKPIVILHGLLGSSKNWTQQAKVLAKHFKVYCVDLPNHGKSYASSHFDYAQIATNLNNWVSNNFDEQAHLIGHSMGGKVAMKCVDLQPNLFDKLIVVDIAPVTYPAHHKDIFNALNAVNLATLKSRKEADSILQKRIETTSIRNFLLHSLVLENNTWSWAFNLKNLAANQQEVAVEPLLQQQINNPTLFIKGESSDYIKQQHQSILKKHYANLSFKQIANSGHWPHAEKPKVFSHIVQSFLSV